MIQKRQELLQFWIDKHESDVEQKQRELDLLKSAKAKDAERLQELTRLVNIYIGGLNNWVLGHGCSDQI